MTKHHLHAKDDIGGLSDRLVYVGIALGVLYWMVESAAHVIFLNDRTFFGQLLRPDTNEWWLRLTVVVMFAGFGKCASVMLARRRRIETIAETSQKELGINKAPLRSIMDNAATYLELAGAIFVALDQNERVTLVNRKGCEILEAGPDDILGKNWFDHFIPEEFREQVRTVFEKLMAGDIHPVEFYENEILTSKGERKTIQWHNTVLRDNSGRIVQVLSSGEDITEKRRLESQIRRAQKMEAIGTLAGGIAHDFNNILTPILIQSQLAKLSIDSDNPVQGNLDEVILAAQRARDLVKQILTFCRQSESGRHRLTVAPIIKE
ncbi:MAG: PAS domain S-box protein, partial [Deltaproteobacteria bacterium]|nr:PAS domain S-box protein [Deltaproteobacteria bacterium]